jgi:YcaO-like protein with predicted kinase domain
MEAIELYHAERIQLPLKLGSARELAESHRLIDLDSLPQRAGTRFHPDLPMLWIEGHDLLTSAPTWVLYEVVHTNYTLPLPTGSGCFPASSNGLASGNHLLEAINHGICEVVERDSVTLWNHLDTASRARTRLDLGSIDDDCAQVVEQLERAGFAVAVWDTSTDVGIASFYCLITDRRHVNAHSGAGAGTHPARAIALLRALSEAIQVRTTYITGSRDDLRPDEFTPPGIEQKLRRARRLMAGHRASPRAFCDVPTHEAVTCADDLDWMLGRLRAVHIAEVITLDLTRPEVGVPVVRVVIPGLEGPDDHDAYVPGPRARRVVGQRR